jgi:hypothetical protein
MCEGAILVVLWIEGFWRAPDHPVTGFSPCAGDIVRALLHLFCCYCFFEGFNSFIKSPMFGRQSLKGLNLTKDGTRPCLEGALFPECD